jgi:predicted  nucleic acid-binding Zn-ribbon protein
MPEKPRGREVLNDLMEGTRKLLSRLREDVDEISNRSKHRLDILSLKNRRAKAFRELGMRMYVLIRNRKYSVPEVKGLLEELQRLEGEIASREQALKLLDEAVAKPAARRRGTVARPAARPPRRKAPPRRNTGTGTTPETEE